MTLTVRFPLSLSSVSALLALAVLLTLGASAPVAANSTAADGHTEKVTVTANRLPDETELKDVPAHVTVIEREQIEQSGAATLQDLLLREAGILLHDQVGNDIQKNFSMRGLGGSGTRVFLDGAPVNDPRNNGLSLELISLDALERIQIIRGSSASLAGGGTQAGVVHLTSRRGSEKIAGSLTLSGGTDDTQRIGGNIGGQRGRWDYFLSATSEDTDGFRDNSGGDTGRYAATLGTTLAKDRRLELNLVSSQIDLGNPGALTGLEIEANPEQAPFNSLDFTDQQNAQASINYSGVLAGSWSMAANLFYRDRSTESLTTGRSASISGGFFLDAEESTLGSTVQVSHRTDVGTGHNRFTVGLEWLDSETDATGIATLVGSLGVVDAANLSSDNTTERQTAALFAQNTWQPNEAWSFMVGLRADDDEVGYDERFPTPGNSDRKEFSEVSLRAGANWNPSARVGVYASYGEAYLPPTVEQMFSFPTFGSNPNLEPEDSESWELGLRLRGAKGPAVDVALFVIDKDNEIVFDPTSPLAAYGANENLGSTRREGLEATVRGRVAEGFGYYATLTVLDAEFQNGANEGRTIPLVPEQQLATGLNVSLTEAIQFSIDGVYVGKQVLDNDAARSQPKLDDYIVFNARVSWQTGLGSNGADGKGLELFVEGKNLFDEEYATRGIYAFDFSALANRTFLTPGPDARVQLGARFSF